MLTHATLDELKRSIRAVAGDESASEILFRLGRMVGAGRKGIVGELDLDAGLRRGLAELRALGIAGVHVEAVERDEDGRMTGLTANIVVPREESGAVEQRTPGDQGPREGATCGVAAGFVTGLAAALTGLDLVCDWLECPTPVCGGSEPTACCRFQVRPAHLGPPRGPDGEAGPPATRPEGSASFFLGTVGSSLGNEPIGLGNFLESSGDGIVILDLAGTIRFWNEGAERLFGYTRDEMVGHSFERIVPPDLLEAGELEDIAAAVAEHGSLDNHVTRRLTRSGAVLEVSLTRSALRGASGQVLGSIGVLRDLTSHRRTELALEEARHLARIGEMSATVAHDIKNPLAAIHAAVQYLSREESSAEERVEMLGEVSKEVRRVDETIHDLLRFSRPRPPDLEPTLVSELVQGTLAELKLTVELGQQGLDVAVEPGLSVPLDRRMMRRVLHNLLVNAFQATEAVGPARGGPGQVTVRAWADGDRAVVEVRDTGTGVADGLKLQLFEPFVTSKVRGTGLGLAVARRFVEAHGGEIRLHASDSSGSSFRLWLPRTVRP